MTVNNLVYNPGGLKGSTMFLKQAGDNSVVGNVLLYGPNTPTGEYRYRPDKVMMERKETGRGHALVSEVRGGKIILEQIPLVYGTSNALYMDDNHVYDMDGSERPAYVQARGYHDNIRKEDMNIVNEKPFWSEGLKAMPTGRVQTYVLSNAGARPWDRDETDRRIIRTVRVSKRKIIWHEEDVGGYPEHEKVEREEPLEVPQTNRRKWLAEFGKDND
ncbi:MAG: hypothetical protein ACQER7_12530 [Bacteroidota bacterium]